MTSGESSSDPTSRALGEQYCRFVDRVHGTYLDATLAMGSMASWYMQSSRARWDELEKNGKPLTWDEFNPEIVYAGSIQGEPGDLHRSRLHDVIARNVPSGGNWAFLGLMCVVGVYQVWDEYYRVAIAKARGVPADDLRSDIFGELRHLRHAIIHRQGYASDKVALAKLTRAFAEGDPIKLEPEDLHDIVHLVKAATRALAHPFPA